MTEEHSAAATGVNSENSNRTQKQVQISPTNNVDPLPIDLDPSRIFQQDDSVNYFHESCRLYLANVLLTTQLKDMLQEKMDLTAKIYRLEKNSSDYNSINTNTVNSNSTNGKNSSHFEDKKRRHRRSASQIERRYCCPIETCQKQYGSEGSLQQHLKLKHPEFNLKEFSCKPTVMLLAESNKEEDEVTNENYDENEELQEEEECNDEEHKQSEED